MNPAENYILNQPEPYRSILFHLQVIIKKTLPEADLKFKWKVPFYYFDKTRCYLNMPKNKNFVDLGFWNAAHLTVHLDHMTIAGRKMMRSIRYKTLDEIDNKILVETLLDAYSVKDKKFWK